jgi:hypothetical protein
MTVSINDQTLSRAASLTATISGITGSSLFPRQFKSDLLHVELLQGNATWR